MALADLALTQRLSKEERDIEEKGIGKGSIGREYWGTKEYYREYWEQRNITGNLGNEGILLGILETKEYYREYWETKEYYREYWETKEYY